MQDEALRAYDASCYHIECIRAAAYRLGAKLTATVEARDDKYLCTFRRLDRANDWESLLFEFDQELNDQELRKSLSERTEGYRNLILGLAFSKTGLQSDE